MSEEYDMSIHTNPDAKAWVEFYKKTFPEADEELMLCWFANAMMAIHDHLHNKKIEPLQEQQHHLIAKLGLISTAVADNDIDEVKRLLPMSGEQVVREIQAEAVETAANDYQLRVLDGPDIYSDGLIEYANQLRNPEQEKE